MSIYNAVKHHCRQAVFHVCLFFLGASVILCAAMATSVVANAQSQAQCRIDSARRAALQQMVKTLPVKEPWYFKTGYGEPKLMVKPAQQPWYAGELTFEDAQGRKMRLADFKGKTLLVNLWGVWCAPCRKEMPDLARLRQKMGGDAFDVVTVNDGRQREKAAQFLRETGADSLPLYFDASIYRTGRKQGVISGGLPFTMLVDKTGCLMATLTGSAPWDGEDALRLLRAVRRLE